MLFMVNIIIHLKELLNELVIDFNSKREKYCRSRSSREHIEFVRDGVVEESKMFIGSQVETTTWRILRCTKNILKQRIPWGHLICEANVE